MKGDVLRELGNSNEAIKAYEKSIEINPQSVDAWNNKELALRNLKRYNEALEAYDKAIEINPQDSIAWYNRACMYYLINNKDQSILNLKKAINLDSWYKEKAQTDDGFKGLRMNEQFKKLTN
jgi:tetratricopeptide (TPR) repeat protein